MSVNPIIVIYKIKKFIEYYFKADTAHNIHSPFVYDFIQDVLDTSKHYYAFNHLEHERRILESNSNKIKTQDFGAGSQTIKVNEKVIGDIARNVMSNQKKCRFLFNVVNTYNIKNTLELGTSLGISAIYMASASSKNHVYTIEADPNVYKLAKVLFEKNKMTNIHPINNKFEVVLDETLSKMKSVDLAYIDGNHSYKATMENYTKIKKFCYNKSIIIFDDIYWSEGMTQAWQEIKKDKSVRLSIDVFDFGIVFFDDAFAEPKHYTLIDSKWKPYRIGLIP